MILELAAERGTGCTMVDAWQDATTSNSELLRGVATQPGAEQRVPCDSSRIHSAGELVSLVEFAAG